MITGLHHVAAVVETLEEGAEVWRDGLGLRVDVEATVPAQGVRAALLPCGGGEIEMLEPLADDSPIAKFGRRGGGIHHICLESDDVAGDLARLDAAGIALIDKTPRPGLAGQIGFLHPKATLSSLIELATPGGGVETTAFAQPDPPADACFDAQTIVGVVFAVRDIAAAAEVFRTCFEFEISDSRVQLPEIGAEAVRIETGAALIDLATPVDDTGVLSARLDTKGEGAAVLRLGVSALEPGTRCLVAEGATVTETKDATGDAVILIEGSSAHGIELALTEV